MSSVVTKKFVEDGFGYLNARDLVRFFDLYAADMRSPSLENLGLPTSKQGFETFVNGFYTSFSGSRFLPQRILCDGDTTMFHWIFEGKHTGDFNGIPATGKDVRISAFTTFRLGPDGKVIEQHDLADLATLMRQLGVA